MRGTGWLAAAAAAAVLQGGAAHAASAGENFRCHFPRAGLIIIDTREPGSTLTVGGRTYPVQGRSYFYQGEEGRPLIAFGPGLRWWEYRGERSTHCEVRANRPAAGK